MWARQTVLRTLFSYFKTDQQNVGIQSIGGGDINEAFKIKVGGKLYFIKVNDADKFPEMFVKEQRGLSLLQQSEFRIPKVLDVLEEDSVSILLLEWIESGHPGTEFWRRFGHCLAELHTITQHQFGLDHDNYIGSLPQANNFTDDWIDFFVNERILPQLNLAITAGLLDHSDLKQFDTLRAKLSEFFPTESPSLIHGDLWSGNFMCDQDGHPALIDPAVHFGHRLMDIGMTRLFGGFHNEMYQAYNAEYPLPTNCEEACDIANLYPLLVHVNLFGRSYVPKVRRVLADGIG